MAFLFDDFSFTAKTATFTIDFTTLAKIPDCLLDDAHLKGMLTLERVNIIDSQNSIVRAYHYDALGRILQTASGALVLESAASAGGRIVNVNANPDGSVSSTMPDLQVGYFITDHLGSVRLIADAAGNVLERNDFLPFGEKCQNPSCIQA